tara:strand:+ start:490 stop:612 length:123 start_codon:yes stop_codon:yes gene_type:complete
MDMPARDATPATDLEIEDELSELSIWIIALEVKRFGSDNE